jgi:hypothetical protein
VFLLRWTPVTFESDLSPPSMDKTHNSRKIFLDMKVMHMDSMVDSTSMSFIVDQPPRGRNIRSRRLNASSWISATLASEVFRSLRHLQLCTFTGFSIFPSVCSGGTLLTSIILGARGSANVHYSILCSGSLCRAQALDLY